jgi:hypothetical protein
MSRVVVIAVIIAAIAGGAFFFMRKHQAPTPPPPIVAPTPPPAPPPPLPVDAAPAIQNPIESPPTKLPGLADSDAYVKDALTQLLGRKAIGFLNLDGFIRRFVITVDNLGGEHAPLQQWPIYPPPGRFETDAGAIAARNAVRYAVFVRFVDAIDLRKAVALYGRLYPLCQQAYEELGYPGKYFNDRLVAVLDELLATPEAPEPLKVHVVEVKGANPSAPRLYQFDDPALESRAAGQKILLRMGHVNEAHLKAKLRELRGLVARGPGGRARP